MCRARSRRSREPMRERVGIFGGVEETPFRTGCYLCGVLNAVGPKISGQGTPLSCCYFLCFEVFHIIKPASSRFFFAPHPWILRGPLSLDLEPGRSRTTFEPASSLFIIPKFQETNSDNFYIFDIYLSINLK